MAMLDADRWRWLGVEFLVIVLGVLSALFVDTWLEERQDAERAEVYRQRLIADLESDITNLSAVQSYYTRIRAFGLLMLDDLEGRATLDDFALAMAAFNAAEEWGFQLETATYTDLKSTGGLSLIEDVQLRLDLGNYYSQAITRSVVWLLPRDFRESARGIIPNDLQAAIHTECSEITDDVMQVDTGIALPALNFRGIGDTFSAGAELTETCGIDPSQFDLTVAAQTLRSDPEVARELRFRMSEIRVSISLFEGQKQMAQDLLARLREGG